MRIHHTFPQGSNTIEKEEENFRNQVLLSQDKPKEYGRVANPYLALMITKEASFSYVFSPRALQMRGDPFHA